MTVIASHHELTLNSDDIEQRTRAISSGKRDEFGVQLLNVFYNEQGRTLCINDAPNADAVRMSHQKLGVPCCDEIVEMECLGC